ncbi:MAG TPA: hypothetical protein VK772_05205 [Puia sp.]|nr:hypothetical protein [Puia sp.]
MGIIITAATIFGTLKIIKNSKFFENQKQLQDATNQNLDSKKREIDAEIREKQRIDNGLKDNITELREQKRDMEADLRETKYELDRTKGDLKLSQIELQRSENENSKLNSENKSLIDGNDTLKAHNRKLEDLNYQLDIAYKDKRDDGVFERNLTKKWADEADSLKKELQKFSGPIV